MQLDFFYHNRTPSYASMSTISGHVYSSEPALYLYLYMGSCGCVLRVSGVMGIAVIVWKLVYCDS